MCDFFDGLQASAPVRLPARTAACPGSNFLHDATFLHNAMSSRPAKYALMNGTGSPRDRAIVPRRFFLLDLANKIGRLAKRVWIARGTGSIRRKLSTNRNCAARAIGRVC